MILSGIFTILFAICMFIPDEMLSDTGSLVVFIALFGTWGIPVFMLSLVLYIDSTVYLKRLEKNHFTVPHNKKDYDNDLSRVPRDEVVENVYASDSRITFIMSLAVYFVLIICDLLYLKTWIGYEPDSVKGLFPLLLAFHLIFLILAFVYKSQGNTDKYVDAVDVRDRRKARTSITGAIGTLIILGCIGAYSVATAHSMTKYIYKSRYGHDDKELSQFWAGASMTVTSDSLHDGKWDDEITNTENGSNLSPQLSFDSVPGAEYYVIYMTDESANNWVHWIATDIKETELALGENMQHEQDPSFKYVGPYPPKGSGEHIYTIYVYALKGDPDSDFEYEFDDTWFAGDYLYYEHLNLEKRDDINTYGNVLAYGYISGVYSR